MLNKLTIEDWKLHLQTFLAGLPEPLGLKLVGFHPVQLPVVISEASVQMRSVNDYSVLSLLILRLFDAGIHNPEAIQSISGMSEETVKVYLKKEMLMLGHIDANTNQLTEEGKETLRLNADPENDRVYSCEDCSSVLRVHIDPLTASLIPQYLEWELPDNFEPNQDAGDFLRPRAYATIDEAFREELRKRLTVEINQRKDEYVRLDAFKNGDVLNHVNAIQPIHIFYRWGYLAKFEGMQAPLIVLTGRKSVKNVNKETAAKGEKAQYAALPFAVSRTDYSYLEENGIHFNSVIVRDDDCFEELIAVTADLVLTLPEDEGD